MLYGDDLWGHYLHDSLSRHFMAHSRASLRYRRENIDVPRTISDDVAFAASKHFIDKPASIFIVMNGADFHSATRDMSSIDDDELLEFSTAWYSDFIQPAGDISRYFVFITEDIQGHTMEHATPKSCFSSRDNARKSEIFCQGVIIYRQLGLKFLLPRWAFEQVG